MKRVIIVGGGYAGIGLARALDRSMDVRLVEPRDGFVHNIGAIRALADPALLSRITMPYDRLLARGQVTQGRATSLGDGGISLEDGRSLEGDFIVLATGSTYATPFKPRGERTADFIAASRACHDRLRAARTVAVVGAGAVGVELIGEIQHHFPDRRLILIGREAAPCSGFNPALGRHLLHQLMGRGIRVILGAAVTNLPADGQPFGPATLTLTDGQTVAADLIFVAGGARPVTGLAGRTDGGRVAVDAWCRPAGQRHVFTLGDMAATGDPMTAVAITRQVPWAGRLLRGLAAGTAIERLKPYRPWPVQPLIVPLGPTGGASNLPVTSRGLVVGPLITATLKGRGLLIGQYRRRMGYEA